MFMYVYFQLPLAHYEGFSEWTLLLFLARVSLCYCHVIYKNYPDVSSFLGVQKCSSWWCILNTDKTSWSISHLPWELSAEPVVYTKDRLLKTKFFCQLVGAQLTLRSILNFSLQLSLSTKCEEMLILPVHSSGTPLMRKSLEILKFNYCWHPPRTPQLWPL